MSFECTVLTQFCSTFVVLSACPPNRRRRAHPAGRFAEPVTERTLQCPEESPSPTHPQSESQSHLADPQQSVRGSGYVGNSDAVREQNQRHRSGSVPRFGKVSIIETSDEQTCIDVFVTCRKLKRLNLGGNELTSVPQKSLGILDTLRKLEIQENKIRTIKEGDFEGNVCLIF